MGNTLHLAGALLNAHAGTRITHVPYKSAGQAIAALLGSEVQVLFIMPQTGLAQIRSGRMRALAYNNPTRSPHLPDVPTMAEAGLAGMDFDASWYGLFAPAKTPEALIARLHAEVRAALAQPAVRERLSTLTLDPVANPPARSSSIIRCWASVSRVPSLFWVSGTTIPTPDRLPCDEPSCMTPSRHSNKST